MEMLLATGLLLMIFLGLFLLSANKSNEISDTKLFLDKRSTCLELADILTEAYLVKGLNVTFLTDYDITLTKDSHTIEIEQIYCSLPFSFDETININKGKVKIENVEGEIKIENVT